MVDVKDLGRLIRSSGSPRRRKGSGALKEEIGVWKRKGQTFFSTFLSLSHIKLFFFPLSPELMIIQQTTQFKFYTKEYRMLKLPHNYTHLTR